MKKNPVQHIADLPRVGHYVTRYYGTPQEGAWLVAEKDSSAALLRRDGVSVTVYEDDIAGLGFSLAEHYGEDLPDAQP